MKFKVVRIIKCKYCKKEIDRETYIMSAPSKTELMKVVEKGCVVEEKK